jgi:putative ABC transport system permease protein
VSDLERQIWDEKTVGFVRPSRFSIESATRVEVRTTFLGCQKVHLPMRSFLISFALAFQNIRANLFHTLLSVLGIVIGVGALVAILSFIDGLERFAQQQIADTTNLKSVMVVPRTHKTVNGLDVRKDSLQVIDYERFKNLMTAIQPLESGNTSNAATVEIKLSDSAQTLATVLHATSLDTWPDSVIASGRALVAADHRPDGQVVFVNQRLARLLLGADSTASPVGRFFIFQEKKWQVIGVKKVAPTRPGQDEEPPRAYVPIATQSLADLRRQPPTCVLTATTVEDIAALKTRIGDWQKQTFGAQNDDFEIISNDFRVDQAAKAFLVFRIIMGLIVGISVVVGGVGVMNVLLISVNERTPEIGLRKAVGAKKSDIRRLFLAESIAVSVFGSFAGLLLGVLVTLIAAPIIEAVSEVPFRAAYTWHTFGTIGIVAVLIGVVFGTWPAIKAARLDPVEAIRRE